MIEKANGIRIKKINALFILPALKAFFVIAMVFNIKFFSSIQILFFMEEKTCLVTSGTGS